MLALEPIDDFSSDATDIWSDSVVGNTLSAMPELDISGTEDADITTTDVLSDRVVSKLDTVHPWTLDTTGSVVGFELNNVYSAMHEFDISGTEDANITTTEERPHPPDDAPEPESSELWDWVPALTLLTVWGVATHFLAKSLPDGTPPPTL